MRVILAFVVAMIYMIWMIRKKTIPTFFLLTAALIAGLIAGLPFETIGTTIVSSFGEIAVYSGLIVVMGVVFAQFLSDSNGITSLANTFIKRAGPNGSVYAIFVLGYVLSIPINFTPAGAIMCPLLRPIAKKSNKPMIAVACAFSSASFLTSCCVLPTMTPTTVAGLVGVNFGWAMAWSIVVTIPCALIFALGSALFLAKKYGKIEKTEDFQEEIVENEGPANAPSAGTVVGLILLPIVLILLGTFGTYLFPAESAATGFLALVGNPPIALLIGILVEMLVLRKYATKPLMTTFSNACNTSGGYVVTLGAANAFGGILTAAGIGDVLLELTQNLPIPLLLLAWLLTLVLRSGTGVMTVAAVTVVPMLLPTIQAANISPILFMIAVCLGCTGLMIPTDPAFWFYKECYGISTKETFVGITIPTTLESCVGIVIVLLLSAFGSSLPGLF